MSHTSATLPRPRITSDDAARMRRQIELDRIDAQLREVRANLTAGRDAAWAAVVAASVARVRRATAAVTVDDDGGLAGDDCEVDAAVAALTLELDAAAYQLAKVQDRFQAAWDAARVERDRRRLAFAFGGARPRQAVPA